MHTWFRRILYGAAVMAVVMVPQRSSAQTTLTGGEWQLFEFFEDELVGLPSPIAGDGFSFSAEAGQQVRLRIVDLGVSGDRFNLFANDILRGSTSEVPPDVDTGIFDGDEAFASPALSQAEFFFGAGSYTFTLELLSAVPGFFFGEGAIRADLLPIDNPPPPPVPVPEPSTVWLLLVGLSALATVARRRSARRA